MDTRIREASLEEQPIWGIKSQIAELRSEI